MTASTISEWTAVVDWRERMFALYAEIRVLHPADPEAACGLFRRTRDDLFKHHPASPLDDDQRRRFEALPYFDYRPDLNLEAKLVPGASSRAIDVELTEDDLLRMRPIADAVFTIGETTYRLPVYWLEGYAGGIFVPFKDATTGKGAYGGGRYLFDTRKGANLGIGDGSITFDFNFAYNPSCAYHPRWTCPLASPASELPIPIEAGERNVIG